MGHTRGERNDTICTRYALFHQSQPIDFLDDKSLQDLIAKSSCRIVLVDVRTKEEFKVGHFPSDAKSNIEVRNVPWQELKRQFVDPNWKNNIVIYHCQSGGRTKLPEVMHAIITHHQRLGNQSNLYCAANGLQQLERVFGVNRISTQEESREPSYKYMTKL